ncbi:PilN domain-containing protein [Kineosporia sp. J2-2]|uniref:PilN domain-containing protein n=1 Tax=Kineosporia corallincola TaxID=2835133 RepID=A0ABS5TCY6_9ACTN|nr:PilN domain-containing protein [Kineosporia corallincola]MBT0768947.1 PilN domain-containing protein [Kineosporia corallincola]
MTEDATATQVQPVVTPGPKPLSWAPVPKVNLLPIEVLEGRSFQRTQLVLAAVVLVVAGAIGVATVWAQNGKDDAQAQADAAQARVSRLQQQQTEYSEVPKIYAQVEAATAARKQALIGDAPWYRYMNELDDARPPTVDFSSVQMTLAAAGSSAVDPLTPAGAATLTIAGQGQDYKGVAEWMDAFDDVPGLQSAKLTSATRTESQVTTFTTVGVAGGQALSGRYQTDDDSADDETADK